MPSNTQNFRVKHGLEVVEAASFSNTITATGNVNVSNATLVITGDSVPAINAQGTSYFSNTLTVANGGIVSNSYNASASVEAFRAVAANSTVTQSLIVNTSAITVSGNLTVTGVTTFNSTEVLSVGTGEIILYANESGAPSANAGVTVNRGTSADTKILWDEENDRWLFTNDGSTYYPFRTYSSLVYKFSTNTTTAADPGQGFIRFNSGTYSGVTEIAIDLQEIGGTDVSALLALLDDSTSTDRAVLTFRSSQLQDKFVVFRLSSNIITATSGVLRLPVTHVSGGGTTFNANEILFVEYNLVGEKGAQGVQGATGSQGATGPQGAAGPQGVQGAAGAQGSQGDTGPQGSQGVTGALGPTGPQGPQGRQGSVGPQGSQGDAGPQGPQGPQGRQGNQGFQGQAITGAQGPQGAQGNQGYQGQTGPQGPQGPQGITGATGSQGPQGVVGPQGPQGPQGHQGTQGYQGYQGVVGSQGVAGGFTTSSDAEVNSLGVGTSASATTGEIRAIDNITAYYSSDIKFKENIEDISNAVDIASAIGGKYFQWTDEYMNSRGGYDGYFVRKSDLGVIAQDVQLSCPLAVRQRPDGSLAVDYPKLVAIAFAAIKELKEELDSLKK